MHGSGDDDGAMVVEPWDKRLKPICDGILL